VIVLVREIADFGPFVRSRSFRLQAQEFVKEQELVEDVGVSVLMRELAAATPLSIYGRLGILLDLRRQLVLQCSALVLLARLRGPRWHSHPLLIFV
jgi:hypothetical protein